MADKKKLVEAITSREEDFAKWYTDVVTKAELVAYSTIKGCTILKPAGYAIWENIMHELDRRFKETGVEKYEEYRNDKVQKDGRLQLATACIGGGYKTGKEKEQREGQSKDAADEKGKSSRVLDPASDRGGSKIVKKQTPIPDKENRSDLKTMLKTKKKEADILNREKNIEKSVSKGRLKAAALALAAILAMTIPVIKYSNVGIVDYKRKKNKKKDKAFWQKMYLDVIILAQNFRGGVEREHRKAIHRQALCLSADMVA